jgi:hypothetical protein
MTTCVRFNRFKGEPLDAQVAMAQPFLAPKPHESAVGKHDIAEHRFLLPVRLVSDTHEEAQVVDRS